MSTLLHNIPQGCFTTLITFLLFVSLSGLASAKVTVELKVEGVEGRLRENVLALMTLNRQKDSERLQSGRVRRLHQLADEEIAQALSPFGYFSPVITSSLLEEDGVFFVEYVIDPGPTTTIEAISLQVAGEGADNPIIRQGIAKFPMQKGDILDQEAYEKAKKELVSRAFGEGFLDAEFPVREIRVDAGQRKAFVTLVLQTGKQYYFGEITTTQEILRDNFLRKYFTYQEGEPYRASKLFELQSTLYKTDYFSRVKVRGLTEQAVDFRVPIQLDLVEPEHRNKYTLGVGYATDTGARGKIDWANRLFNRRGHRMNASLQLAERDTNISVSYIVPRLDPRYNSIEHQLAFQDKEWEDTNTQLFTAGVKHLYDGEKYSFSAGLMVRDEIYDVGDTSGDSTLLLPTLSGGFVVADNLKQPNNGLKASVTFLGGAEGVVSDTSFLQATVDGKTILTPHPDWRLIGRGSLGATMVDSIDSLPPSLRFYTGGDATLRGYKYREIGSRDSSGTVIGGKYLVVGSAELERIITGRWSMATFWDVGTATDDLSLNFYQGAGLGVRFRLPFGQIRLDLASAVSEDGMPIRLHFNVGGDL